MSEEEKEAVKYFYNLRATIDESNMLFDEDINVKCGKETIKQITTVLNLIEKQQKEIDDWKFTAKYVEDNYISKDKIKKDLKTCEKVYEREMKPYKRDYGLDVSLLNRKEKAELINKRNCLITQMETYKQLLGGIENE